MTTLRIKGMHCTACEKTITRMLAKEGLTVKGISYKTGEADVSGSLPEARIDALLRKRGYSLEKERTKPHDYTFEKEIIAKGLLALAITAAVQAALIFLLYRLFPGYHERYLLPFLYLPVVIVTNIVALWHQRAYAETVSCMTGMMVGMTIGMTSGFALGAVVGLTNGMFVGSVVGVAAAMAAGIYAGRCCGTMGVMEGMMAGLMGGTMGPMISVMMYNDRIGIFLPLLILITIAILGSMMRITIEEHQESEAGLRPWPFLGVLAASMAFTIIISIVMLLAPKGIFG